MNRKLHQAILGKLQITEDPTRTVPWQSFSNRDWKHALDWLDLSGLAVYFARRIRESKGTDSFPDDLRVELARREASNVLRTRAIVQEFRIFTKAFRASRVKYAVLKGIALVPDYCPDPVLRTQYDHDVLVDAASLAAAETALQTLGYQRKPGKADDSESTIVYRSPEPRIRFARNSEGLYSPDLLRSIELHLGLWEEAEEKIDVNLSGDFLERQVVRSWDGLNFVALCDEDSLLFQILHAFKHILRNWCRLSIFLEIGTFLQLRASDAGFWERFAARISNVRWAPEATFVVLTLAGELFGATIPPQLEEQLVTETAPALNLWIERYGRRAALSNFHGDKSSLFLHREFVERPEDWAAVRRRKLFPIQRPHRPPALVFQRGFSTAGRLWMEQAHALRRLMFHGLAGLRYAVEVPRWSLLRRFRLADSGDA